MLKEVLPTMEREETVVLLRRVERTRQLQLDLHIVDILVANSKMGKAVL